MVCLNLWKVFSDIFMLLNFVDVSCVLNVKNGMTIADITVDTFWH